MQLSKQPFESLKIRSNKTYLLSFIINIGVNEMFCPSCGKQNQDDILFCSFCGKALPKKNSLPLVIQSNNQANPSPKKASAPKIRISFTAVKAIITGLLIVGLIVVLLLIYYPGIFH
jgi:uncharacterized membrane protein YvbJ